MSSPPAEPAPAVTSPGNRKRNPNGKDTAMTCTPAYCCNAQVIVVPAA